MSAWPTFGRPEWFRGSQGETAWKPFPITWQGRVYNAVWLATVLAPAVLLWQSPLALEAICWLGVTATACRYDIKQICCQANRAGHQPSDEPMNMPSDAIIATKHYDFFVRPSDRMK